MGRTAEGELRMSKQWFGGIGCGIGAIAGGMLWRALTPELEWVGSAIGVIAGLYFGYWLHDKTVKHRD